MLIKKHLTAVLLACLFAHTASAKTASPLSDEKMIAGVCIVATSGVHTAISERQAGSDKASTKRLLDGELTNLRRSFSNQAFLQGISDSWGRALDSIYALPVEATPEGKQAMVSAVTKDAFISCMNNFGTH